METVSVSIHPLPTRPPHVAPARIGAGHIEAAASLVRRGMATRVVICNTSVEDGLPCDWIVDGVLVHLDRDAGGLAQVTAGMRPARAGR